MLGGTISDISQFRMSNMSLMNQREKQVYRESLVRSENVVSNQVYMIQNSGIKLNE